MTRWGGLRWLAALILTALAALVAARGDGAEPGPRRASPAPTRTPAPAVRDLLEVMHGGAPTAAKRRALVRYLERRGVSAPTIQEVLRHTRPGIVLREGRSGSPNRLGGRPLLPPATPWPTSASGRPLTFVAAFDFAALPRVAPLPAAGRLSLFWNASWSDEEGSMDLVAGTRAFWFPPGARAVPARPPRETFPHPEHPWRGVAAPVAGDPDQVYEAVAESPDAERLVDAMNDAQAARLYPHHLLGSPIEIQGPVLEGVPALFVRRRGYLAPASYRRYTRDEREAGDWMLLAQINSDERFMVGDAGTLLFVMLRSDLAARRFDRVIAVMESH